MSDPVAVAAPAVEEKGEADAEFSLGDFSGMKKKKKKKVVAEEKNDVAAAEAGVEAGSASAVAAPAAPQEVGVLAAGESEGRPTRPPHARPGWLAGCHDRRSASERACICAVWMHVAQLCLYCLTCCALLLCVPADRDYNYTEASEQRRNAPLVIPSDLLSHSPAISQLASHTLPCAPARLLLRVEC